MSAIQVVELNVGGHLFTTTRTTLCKYGNTMLASMFAGDMTPAYVDSQGRYFIDRDGTHFATILAYLREEPIRLPLAAKEKAALASEASFYQVCSAVPLGGDSQRHAKPAMFPSGSLISMYTHMHSTVF